VYLGGLLLKKGGREEEEERRGWERRKWERRGKFVLFPWKKKEKSTPVDKYVSVLKRSILSYLFCCVTCTPAGFDTR